MIDDIRKKGNFKDKHSILEFDFNKKFVKKKLSIYNISQADVYFKNFFGKAYISTGLDITNTHYVVSVIFFSTLKEADIFKKGE